MIISLINLVNLILEAFEYQITLFIFELFDSILIFHIIDFHGLTYIHSGVFRMEHMSTEVEDGTLVNFGTFIV